MKLDLILAAAGALAASAAVAAPFPAPQSVVATKIGYQSIAYTIKSGDVRRGIKLPVTNRPVQMMVTDVTPYYESLGEVTLVSNPGLTLQWIGSDLKSNSGGTATFDQGYAQGRGTHIMWADNAATVDVQVQNETTLQIRNKSGEAQTVIVTFTW